MKKTNITLLLSFIAISLFAQTGNVGIGTITPLQKLHVDGNLMLDGRTLYLGPSSTLFTGVSTLYFDSQSSNASQFILRDLENDYYGRVYGSGNGNSFGLMDKDGNWVFQSSLDNYLGFRIDNSEKVRILASGNFGIGTTGPTQTLDVNGTARIRSLGAGAVGDQVLVVDNTGVIKKRAAGDESSTNELPLEGADTDVTGNVVNIEPQLDFVHTINSPATAFDLQIGGSEKLKVKSNGYVGIGTSTPVQQLHITGNMRIENRRLYLGGSQLLYADNSSALYYYGNHPTTSQFIVKDGDSETYGRLIGTSNGTYFGLWDANAKWIIRNKVNDFLGFYSNTVEAMRINATGDLGIGTTAPTQKLDVNGGARIRTIAAGAAGDQVLVVDATGLIKKRTGGDESSTNELPLEGDDTNVSGNQVDIEPKLDFVHTVYSPATNLKLGVGTTERVRVMANGFVGIGVTAPDQRLHTAGNLKVNGRTVFLGAGQTMYGDNNSAIYFDANNSIQTQIVLRDLENEKYGHLYGSGDGQNFGLLDADGNWVLQSSLDDFVAIKINNSEKFRILTNGNVGVGVTAPSERLSVAGNIKVNGRRIRFGNTQQLYGDDASALFWTSASTVSSQIILRDQDLKQYGKLVGSSNGVNFGLADGDGHYVFHSSLDQFIGMRVNNSEKVRILANGNVGIGTTTPDSKLSVNGKVRSKEVLVELVNWPDYVFKETYELPSLLQEEQFINENGHLSGFASEANMNGEISVGDVTKRQQEKIEQIMLHLIDMKKEMKGMQSEIKTLKEENKELKQQIKN